MTTITEKSYLNLLLKKIQNAPYTNNNKTIAGEAPGTSQINIQPSQIWNQYIPNEAPKDLGTATTVTGSTNNYLYTMQTATNYSYIKYYSNVLLSSNNVNNDYISFIYAGSLIGQIPTTNLLINAIPFTQGSSSSYTINLQRSTTNGSTSPTDLIPMASNAPDYPWYFDVDSGYLTFLNGPIPTDWFLFLTFWRYEGTTGVYNDIYDISGNIGIGNINPQYALDVSGTINTNSNVNVSKDIIVNGNITVGQNVTIYSTDNSTSSTTGALVVNGGAGFNGNVWINGNIFANNLNQVIWNSQGINSFSQNTYYLLATMGDYSNNYGSINITGSIGGKNGTNMAVINTTIVTNGNVITPSVIGSIKNYNSINSPYCDIVISYNNTNNNYQTNTKVTDISGVIYDSSNIYFNLSNELIDADQIITGPGISQNAIINSYDNSNNLSINTIGNPLTRLSADVSSVGFAFNDPSNTFIIQRNDISAGYFIDSSAINLYSKPFISNKNNYTYTTPKEIFKNVTVESISGFIQNRNIPGIGGNSYLITASPVNYNGNILYCSASSPNYISNAPILSDYSVNGNKYKLLLVNGSASLQSNSSNTSFYGFINDTSLNTNINTLSNATFITDSSYGTGIADGTFINTANPSSNNYSYNLNRSNTNKVFTNNISGGIHKVGSTYYFTYKNTDPGVNNFISNTGDANYNIPDLSCIFLSLKDSSNSYILTPSANLINLNVTALSRFGLSGENVPYYIVDASTIALPLTNSVYQNFNITGTVPGDIVTTGSAYGGLTTYNADYLADTSNCRHYINVNTINLTPDASAGYATIVTGNATTAGTNITLSASGGIIKVGQFISIDVSGNMYQYYKSSIRVTSWVNPYIQLDSSLNLTGHGVSKIYFYNPDTSLNIIKPSTFTVNKGYQLYSYLPITYSVYKSVIFNFYKPQNYSLYSIRDVSDGVATGPQYNIYLLTNKDGQNSNGYFNLSITGQTANNIIYPFTGTTATRPAVNSIAVKSICDTLTTVNNSFQTTYNTISTISTNDLSNGYSNIVNPILSTYDGSNIQIMTGSNYGSVTIADANLISGVSIKVVIQCSTNNVGFNNNLYFGLGYDYLSPLYTSVPLSLASTTYIANITIPTNQSNSIKLFIYATAVSSGTLNTMFVQNISISKLDTFINGFVGISTSIPAYSLDVSGIINTNNNLYATNIGINTTSITSGYVLDVSGSVQATSYNALSDYRIKENIIPISDTSFSIDSLKPVFYSLKGSRKQDLGFLAHEVQQEIPFLVNGEKDGENMQSLNYNGFISLLVKEIQDLKKEMKVLKEKVRELENK